CVLSFVFSVAARPPHVLSFPTRRSSDLEALEEMDLNRVKLMWVNYPNMPTGANASMELFEKLVAFGKKHQIVICHDNPYSFILKDRKSTRLNSSHVKISYAVFCLKKKIN